LLEILIEEGFNKIYMNSIESNGIHGVDFIKHKWTGNIIKISEYAKMGKAERKDYKIIKHLGIKQEIKENIWLFCLFTSQKTTELNNFIIYNTELTDNFHKYINYPIIVENSTLCEYFIFHSDIQNFPNYCKSYIELSGNKYNATLDIFKDSFDAYIKTLYRADFNNPITIENKILRYYKGEQDILMSYSNSTNSIRYMEITNQDLINFIYKVFEGKNINNEDILKKSIKEIRDNKKILL